MGDAASGDHYCDVGTVLSEMSRKKRRPRRNPYMIRSWTLYIVRFEGGYYYVTTTAPKNFIGPINQHGGPTGASVNKSRKLKEIVEVRPLGAMPCYKAEYIENNFMLLSVIDSAPSRCKVDTKFTSRHLYFLPLHGAARNTECSLSLV